METLIKLAFGFMLIVSAAAATGSYNNVLVDIYAETSGNSITGNANLAQITEASAFVSGSHNDIYQNIGTEDPMQPAVDQLEPGIFADNNCLTGSGKQTNLIQMVNLVGNATGSYNCVDQNVFDLNAEYNSLTNSNLTQLSMFKADTIGCHNGVDQYTEANAFENCLTLSDMKQIANFDVCAVGDDNYVDQSLYQDASENSATASCLWQQTSKLANILGSCNDVYQNNNTQYADDNCLTGSVLNQVIAENAQITGSFNEIYQGSCKQMETDACANSMTNAQMLQSINSKAIMAGCNNYIDHEISLFTSENCMTGGKLSQVSTVVSND